VKIAPHLALKLPDGEQPNSIGNTDDIDTIVLVSVGFGLKLLDKETYKKSCESCDTVKPRTARSQDCRAESVFKEVHRNEMAGILGMKTNNKDITKILHVEWQYVPYDIQRLYQKLTTVINNKNKESVMKDGSSDSETDKPRKNKKEKKSQETEDDKIHMSDSEPEGRKKSAREETRKKPRNDNSARNQLKVK